MRRKIKRPFRRLDDENVSDADGVDAIKDANAMAGRRPYDPEGIRDAERLGWLGGEPEYEDD